MKRIELQMNGQTNIPNRGPSDTLIDDVRRIRIGICEAVGHDIDRLCDHLQDVSRQYGARQGIFDAVTAEAASRVVEGWGEDAHRRDDAIIDEVRAIRRSLAREKPERRP